MGTGRGLGAETFESSPGDSNVRPSLKTTGLACLCLMTCPLQGLLPPSFSATEGLTRASPVTSGLHRAWAGSASEVQGEVTECGRLPAVLGILEKRQKEPLDM